MPAKNMAASVRRGEGCGSYNIKRSILRGFRRNRTPSNSTADPGISLGAEGGADIVLVSDGAQTPVLTTKAGKLAAASDNCTKPSKKMSSMFGLRKKKGATGFVGDDESRKLGSFIENKNWDGVRNALLCGASIAKRSKEQPVPDKQQCGNTFKGKGSQRQEALAALDQLVDYSGQNALHHMCRFNPPLDVISHVIDICGELSLGLDCLERMPLHIAAGWGSRPEVIVKLLEASQCLLASKELGSEGKGKKNGDTGDRKDILSECLQRVAGKVDTHGKTPLHFAAENLSVQVSRTYGRFGPSFANASVNSTSAENSLRVLKILADASPEAANRKDDDGLTPSDYVLRGSGFGCRGGVDEEKVRRKAVRYLVRARGRKARLRRASRRKNNTSQHLDQDNCESSLSSSDSSMPKIGGKNGLPGKPDRTRHVCQAARVKADRREDDKFAAHLLELMGCSAEDVGALRRDEASIGQMRQIVACHDKNRISKIEQNNEMRSAMPPFNEIEFSETAEIGDDGISEITPPSNMPDWKEGRPEKGKESGVEVT